MKNNSVENLEDIDFSSKRELFVNEVSLGIFSLDTLCWWSHTFNSWSWPEDFPIEKPCGFDDKDNFSRPMIDNEEEEKTGVTKSGTKEFNDSIDGIDKCISRYESLYHHNVFNLKRSVNEFKESWIGWMNDI